MFRKRNSPNCAGASRRPCWPEKETVADASQGVQLATIQKLARYWATDYDWRKCEAKLNACPQFHHRDRRAGHSLHPRPFEARECVAAHRHARLARLDRRADEDHRSADQSDGPWREAHRTRSIVVIPSMPGYGFSGKPTTAGLGSRPHRARLGRADEAPRVHEIRGARRRLGRGRHRTDGRAGTSGIARHPHQHARHLSGRH